MSEVQLICNVTNCTAVLNQKAYITSCSHMFCLDHGKQVTKQNKPATCLVCSAKLTEDCSLLLADLKPDDQYKSMVLNGLHPEAIMDVATRALNFYQLQQSYHLQSKDSAMKNMQRMHDEAMINMQMEINKWQHHAHALKKKLEEKDKELELKEQKYQAERLARKAAETKMENYKKRLMFGQQLYKKQSPSASFFDQNHNDASSMFSASNCLQRNSFFNQSN